MLKNLLAFIGLIVAYPSWAEPFRFHLLSEPHSLDAQAATGTGGNFLFQAIYRGLYRYHSVRGLIPEGARKCERSLKGKVLTCVLNPSHRWSNGEAITAQDYLRSFQRLLDPRNKSPQAELLFQIKGARSLWEGGNPKEVKLGVEALDKATLRFEFEAEDPEFEWKLVQPALAPWPDHPLPSRENAAALVTSGPYTIASWTLGQIVKLRPNPHYGLSKAKRPLVEALVVEEDSTAVRLYEEGKLSFLRRLPSSEIARFKKSPEFKFVPMARFDYVGFGPQLEDHPRLREAMIKALDFKGFQLLFDALGPPGCPSLPMRFMDRLPCLTPDFKKASELMKASGPPPTLSFHFSALGGDDIARAAQWFQGQWKKNLGLDLALQSQEQTVYLRRLRTETPPVFRKGVPLDRPTCLAALELFTRGNPENFIRFSDAGFDELVQKVGRERDSSRRKRLCREGMEKLLNSARMIPLGQMYFSTLAKPQFKGWDLNELNQLDLTDLTEVQ